jgi:hypothetical protein
MILVMCVWHVNMRFCTLGPYAAPDYFPSLKSNHAAVCKKTRDEIHVDRSLLMKGLCPGVQLDVYFPGFPTLKHIPHTVSCHAAYTLNVRCLVAFCVTLSTQLSEGCCSGLFSSTLYGNVALPQCMLCINQLRADC